MGGATWWARRCVDSLPTEQRRVSSSLSLSASLQRLVAVCSPPSPSFLPLTYLSHQLFSAPSSDLAPPSTHFLLFCLLLPSLFLLLLLFFFASLSSHLFIPSAPPPPALPLSLHFIFFKVVSARDKGCLHTQTSFCAF